MAQASTASEKTVSTDRAQKILMLEDDLPVVALLRPVLEEAGFELLHAPDYNSAYALALGQKPALIILDLVVPGGSGFDLCSRLRQQQVCCPIIILSSKSSEADRVLGLELGADDYVLKPFSPREMLARIRAKLRAPWSALPTAESETKELVFGELKIDLLRKRAQKRGKPVDLTATEFSLLAHLAQRAGKPQSREQLLNAVWGYNFEGYLHTVNTSINRLRIKLEDTPATPRYVLTERGHGYRFVEAHELS